MKIAMIQNNYIIANFEENIEKIIRNCQENSHSDMIVFSELCLSGYYPWDLIYRETFQKRQDESLQKLLDFSKTIQSHIVVGMVGKNAQNVGKEFFNSLIVIHQGKIVFDYNKKLLPTYNIFDEKRHFEEGTKSGLAELDIAGKKQRIGFLICEDGWNDESYDYITNPVKDLVHDGASILVSINASPSNLKKPEQRDHIFGKIAKRYGIPFVYVNQIGANDEIVFDGGSFVFNAKGEKVVQLKFFEEDTHIYNVESKVKHVENTPEKYEFIFKQIGLGLKDYLHKQGFKKIIVGCSGGIDSALTLALAKLHLGAENVEAITMPSKYSSSGSVDDSVDLCNRLGIKLYTLPIVNEVADFNKDFSDTTGIELTGVAGENIQARVRGVFLMAYSNQLGNMCVFCGNKSEGSVGYATLYGDTAGSLGIVGDLYKTEVYELSHWLNENFGEIIPTNIVTKPPSAELSPGQKDSDSLPDYDHLDAILKQELEWEYYTQEEQSEIQKLIDEVSQDDYKKVLKLIDRAEFKRRQVGLIVRIHPRAFGSGRKIPIVHKC